MPHCETLVAGITRCPTWRPSTATLREFGERRSVGGRGYRERSQPHVARAAGGVLHCNGVKSWTRPAPCHFARFLRGEYTPGHVLRFMGYLEFADIRLRSLIFGAPAGFPFVPLLYASKVEGFVEVLGIPARPFRDSNNAGPHRQRLGQTRRASLAHRGLSVLPDRARKTVDIAISLLCKAQPLALQKLE